MIFIILSLLTNLLIGFIEFVLGLRIGLKLFAASTRAPFVAWVYRTSQPLLTPFENIFPSLSLGPIIIELSAISALVIYGLAGFIVNQILNQIKPAPKKD